MSSITKAYNAANAQAATAHAKVIQNGFGASWAKVVAQQVFKRVLTAARR